jgi:hypothetical protein
MHPATTSPPPSTHCAFCGAEATPGAPGHAGHASDLWYCSHSCLDAAVPGAPPPPFRYSSTAALRRALDLLAVPLPDGSPQREDAVRQAITSIEALGIDLAFGSDPAARAGRIAFRLRALATALEEDAAHGAATRLHARAEEQLTHARAHLALSAIDA